MVNKEIALQFISSWKQNLQRLEPELVSFSNETNRKPDTFSYVVSTEGLIDPITGRLIKDVVDTKTALGRSEARFLSKTERIISERDEGMVVWFSSPYLERYPCSKVIFYKIAYNWDGQKVTNNSAILFDASSEETLQIAMEVTGERFMDTETLRETALYFQESEPTTSRILELLSKQSGVKEYAFSATATMSQADRFASMIRAGKPTYEIAEEMWRTGFIGNYSISCPPTFSEHTVAFAVIAKLVEHCGRCGIRIAKYISRGYHCPNCGGTYEGC